MKIDRQTKQIIVLWLLVVVVGGVIWYVMVAPYSPQQLFALAKAGRLKHLEGTRVKVQGNVVKASTAKWTIGDQTCGFTLDASGDSSFVHQGDMLAVTFTRSQGGWSARFVNFVGALVDGQKVRVVGTLYSWTQGEKVAIGLKDCEILP